MLDIYEEILKLKKSGGEGVLITVVGKDGHGPASIGDKMLVLNNGIKKGTVGGGAIEEEVSRETKVILKKRKSQRRELLTILALTTVPLCQWILLV